MGDAEKCFLLRAVHALEGLYFENVALNAILEGCSPPNWKALRDSLINNPDVQPEARALFARLRAKAEQESVSDLGPPQVWQLLPDREKPN